MEYYATVNKKTPQMYMTPIEELQSHNPEIKK